MRRFKKNERVGQGGQGAQQLAPFGSVGRRETGEEKTGLRQPGHGQGRGQGRGTRDGDDLHPRPPRLGDEYGARVGQCRRARVRDQGNVFAGQQPGEQLFRFLLFLLAEIAGQGGVDLQVPTQVAGMASVFTGDQVDRGQGLDHPLAEILEVADGGGDNVEPAGAVGRLAMGLRRIHGGERVPWLWEWGRAGSADERGGQPGSA